MNRWKGVAGTLGTALFLGGCIAPLDIDIDWDDDVHGSGRVVTEARVVGSFDAIDAHGAATVIVRRTGRRRRTGC